MDDAAKSRALRRARKKLRGGRARGDYVVAKVFVTTLASFPRWRVAQSLGIVAAEVARVGDIVSNVAIDVRDGWGGRSKALEELVGRAREECLEELRRRAHLAGAHAVVGLRVDVESPAKHLLLVLATGTAVTLEREVAGDSIPPEAGVEPDDLGAPDTCDACGSELIAADDPTAEPTCPRCAADPSDEGIDPGVKGDGSE